MGDIGGNTNAIVQMCNIYRDDLGSQHRKWADVAKLNGFLDLASAGTNHGSLMKRVEESDYIYICDFFEPKSEDGQKLTTENSRILIDGEIYEVKLYDDPMNLHHHMEIYLKYLGGQSEHTV